MRTKRKRKKELNRLGDGVRKQVGHCHTVSGGHNLEALISPHRHQADAVDPLKGSHSILRGGPHLVCCLVLPSVHPWAQICSRFVVMWALPTSTKWRGWRAWWGWSTARKAETSVSHQAHVRWASSPSNTAGGMEVRVSYLHWPLAHFIGSCGHDDSVPFCKQFIRIKTSVRKTKTNTIAPKVEHISRVDST